MHVYAIMNTLFLSIWQCQTLNIKVWISKWSGLSSHILNLFRCGTSATTVCVPPSPPRKKGEVPPHSAPSCRQIRTTRRLVSSRKHQQPQDPLAPSRRRKRDSQPSLRSQIQPLIPYVNHLQCSSLTGKVMMFVRSILALVVSQIHPKLNNRFIPCVIWEPIAPL